MQISRDMQKISWVFCFYIVHNVLELLQHVEGEKRELIKGKVNYKINELELT